MTSADGEIECNVGLAKPTGNAPCMALVEPQMNLLLAALDEPEFDRWSAQLEPVEFHLGQVLYPDGVIDHVYFPTTAIISLLRVMREGSAEVAVVGNEGMVGVSLVLSGQIMPGRALVQTDGTAFRLDAKFMRESFDSNRVVRRLLLRYIQALMTQMSQVAVCNRHHQVEQQVCQWLLLMLDRRHGDQVFMTQELISKMLGVRRGGVTEAAIQLQAAGLIQYSRGAITVINRAGVEQRSCECYRLVRDKYERLLPKRSAMQNN